MAYEIPVYTCIFYNIAMFILYMYNVLSLTTTESGMLSVELVSDYLKGMRS